MLDPVAAYEQVAPFFREISQRRRPYLHSVDQLIIARVPHGSNSMLDVGAGDGTRSARIAREAGLTQLVLLEPSHGMIRNATGGAEIWYMRAEDLKSENPMLPEYRSFDLITCLWNVLGHIRGNDARARVLAQLGLLLSPQGRLIVDVNHRYNIQAYGGIRTTFRFVHDLVSPRINNGDVVVKWRIRNKECRTYGHVFTGREVRDLASSAGLLIAERLVVDYDTGELKRFACRGNLLYVLCRRNSSNESPRALQTLPTSSSVI